MRNSLRIVTSGISTLLLTALGACAEKPAAQTPAGQTQGTQNCQGGFGQFGGGQVNNNQQNNFNNNSQNQQNNQNGFGLNTNCNGSNQNPGFKDPVSGTQYSGDLCSTLSGDTYLASTFGVFIGALCSNGGERLALLRTDQYAYRGNGTPAVIIDAKEDTTRENVSSMQAYAAFLTPASPRSYFELMQRKITQPNQFKLEYPSDTFDPDIVYENQSGSIESGVTYKYTNNSNAPDTIVQYRSVARFLTVVEGKVYVVASEFVDDDEKDTILGVKGLSIINERQGNVTEVVSVSDQDFENGNNHSSAVGDAESNFKNDLNYSYKQALHKHQVIDGGGGN